MWTVYVALCADDSLYTGITLDLEKRILEHNLGTGAKSVKGKLPIMVVYTETKESRSSALKREAAIKKLGRAEKLELISKK